MIHFYGIVILQSDAEVVHPALKVGTDFSVPPLHIGKREKAKKAKNMDVGSNTTLHCKRKDLNRCSPTRIPGQTEIDIAEWEE
jgi:hypothetical protein